MIRRALLAAAACALGASALAAAPAVKTASAARDWSRTVSITPEGGYRMGNPNAPFKLIEYGSLTCAHCATFSKEAMAPLVTRSVRTGRASYEFRNYVLNGIDVTATLLARCAAPANYFKFTETLFANQRAWVDRISGLSEAEKNRLKALPEGERLVRLGQAGGLIAMAGRAGVTPQRARQCLSDAAALERLGKMHEAAAGLGVTGTPTFFLNGRMLGVNTWAEIEPLLRPPGS